MTNSSDRLDRIEALVESNAKSIQALSTTVASVQQQIVTVSTAVDGLAAIQQQLVQIIEEDREDMREFRATTGAALERIDRVMDYLMRRDGEKNS
jgi:DNA-binding FrmR family transcriptional regulator